MTNEIEQKKEYVAPQMEIVEMKRESTLLIGSDKTYHDETL